MSDSALAKKLLIKPGNRVLILNPPDGYLAQLGDLPDGARLIEAAGGPADVVHVFVNTHEELGREAGPAAEALKPGGVLWISYPKLSAGRSTLSRSDMQTALERVDWRPVTQVSIDEVWSAMRFRPTADVKSTRT